MTDEQAAEPQATSRDRLLEAAARLFAERGRDGVSIREIARAAGVRHGGINYHFRSKDELYLEVLLRHGPVAGRMIEGGSIPADLSPEEAQALFARLIRQLVELELQPLDPVAAGLLRGEISRTEGPNEILFQRVIRPHHAALAGLIGQMFPRLTDERERAAAAFNVMSQCIFLRVARPVVLRLFDAEVVDADLTRLVAERIVKTTLEGLAAPVTEPT